MPLNVSQSNLVLKLFEHILSLQAGFSMPWPSLPVHWDGKHVCNLVQKRRFLFMSNLKHLLEGCVLMGRISDISNWGRV